MVTISGAYTSAISEGSHVLLAHDGGFSVSNHLRCTEFNKSRMAGRSADWHEYSLRARVDDVKWPRKTIDKCSLC